LTANPEARSAMVGKNKKNPRLILLRTLIQVDKRWQVPVKADGKVSGQTSFGFTKIVAEWRGGCALNALSAMELDRTEQKKAHLPR
jgi:hypothetical protein